MEHKKMYDNTYALCFEHVTLLVGEDGKYRYKLPCDFQILKKSLL